MPRYIDAETIPDLFNEKFKETQKLIEAGETQLDNLAEGFAEAEKIVLFKAPTADVQEVRHGEWVERVKIRKDGEARLVHWQCSLCGCFLGTNIANYCPNCGAKMDGDEK